MSEKHNDENEDKPKIHIVDKRGVADETQESEGNSDDAQPDLKVVGGGASDDAANEDAVAQDSENELSEEEAKKLQEDMEQQQFDALAEQMGRPLTEGEKESVRQEMKRQAETAMRLEITPFLVQTLSELSGRAAIHLGLMPNPYTRLVARNDKEARLAIDAFEAIHKLIRFGLEGTINKEMLRVLSDLKTNYVNITGNPAPSDDDAPRIIH